MVFGLLFVFVSWFLYINDQRLVPTVHIWQSRTLRIPPEKPAQIGSGPHDLILAMPVEGWLPSSDNDDGDDDDHVCGQEEVRRTQADAATHNGCGQPDVANLPEPTIVDNGRWHNV